MDWTVIFTEEANESSDSKRREFLDYSNNYQLYKEYSVIWASACCNVHNTCARWHYAFQRKICLWTSVCFIEMITILQAWKPVAWFNPLHISLQLTHPPPVFSLFAPPFRQPFLGAFAKLRKATISYIMSVHLSVRMEQLGSHWEEFHEIWYLRIFRKSVENIQVSLKSDKN